MTGRVLIAALPPGCTNSASDPGHPVPLARHPTAAKFLRVRERGLAREIEQN